MNTRKTDQEGTKVCWPQESHDMNTQKSVYRSTKLWTLMQNSLANALEGGHARRKVWWMHGIPTMNADWPKMIAQTSGLECKKIGSWTFGSLSMNARERKKFWSLAKNLEKCAKRLMNARLSGRQGTIHWKWTQERLENTRKSGNERGIVWIWPHEQLNLNAQTSDYERPQLLTWTQAILVNSKESQQERMKVLQTHESLMTLR